jgi:CheY-like chemotaxis protein
MIHANILLVEDDETVLLTLTETLESEGWQVATCNNGLAALALAESSTPYDLFILDNHLPGMDGLEILSRLRALRHRAHTPVLFFSASDCEHEARRGGASEFLKKPEGVKTIVATIARLLVASRAG